MDISEFLNSSDNKFSKNEFIEIGIEKVIQTDYTPFIQIFIKNISSKTLNLRIVNCYYVTHSGIQLEASIHQSIHEVNSKSINSLISNLRVNREITVGRLESDIHANDIIILQVNINDSYYALAKKIGDIKIIDKRKVIEKKETPKEINKPKNKGLGCLIFLIIILVLTLIIF
ncbi:hypothetical protein [Flavobacterium beibuense]|uniref:Uncharacterized protein n=1 Tax=Flavobacterium beibuense TaxID=657326 RepID=A0A444W6P8_9FLAO|nr:hypothetical protein [Flavobacterium beibuense]RYJ41539.1 hypothetical protein NU09_2913 [Flavobacterium beibuense]